VGIFRRIGDAIDSGRVNLTDLKQRKFGSSDKPLSELSDRELEEELIRRRRARAKGRSQSAVGDPAHDPESPQWKQLDQYYANLELKPGASLEQVRRSYKKLMRKYHPDKHRGDEARHKAATKLAQSLTDAFSALSEHLDPQKKR
jgi:DnaJ-domain-containing protein 1